MPAMAAVCERQNPHLSFESEIKTTEYVRTESVTDLTQWQMGHTVMSKQVLGVGGGQIGTKLMVRYQMKQVGEDSYCVTPLEVKAIFYANPQIHIASNFARGSCEYSEVLAHEQKHINTLRKFYREYKDSYQEHFDEAVKNIPDILPVAVADVETEKKRITASIMDSVTDYREALMGELADRQRAIDTLEEYKRVVAKCDNWEGKISGKRN